MKSLNPTSRILSMNTVKSDIDSTRTYASYVVYKGKAALSFKIIPPTYTVLGPQSRTVAREGGILLEFAPTGSQPREYDWSKKVTFLLDALECGELLLLTKDSKNGMEFVHDPNMGGEKSGQITKKLRTVPTPDGKGYFMTLAVNDKANTPVSYSVPVSSGEFEVLQQILVYAIPRILAFDQVWKNSGIGESIGETIPAPPAAPMWKKLTE